MLEIGDVKNRKTAIYIRVSTPEQKVDGYSPEMQKKKLKEHIENNKALGLVFDPKLIFEDVGTGSHLNRDGYKKMMELVKSKKIDVILVWKIDRLSRSLKHLLGIFEELQKNGVSFISVQENIDFTGAIGKLIFNIFGAIGEFERELIRSRTFDGRLTSAELGNYTGTHKYYGYKKVANDNKKGSQLEIVEEEKKWVEQIYHWYIYDELGDKRIAQKLNDMEIDIGIESKAKNRKWTAKRVTTIITNPIYHGKFIAQKTDIHGIKLPQEQWTIVSVSPCISEFSFKMAEEARKVRNAALNQKNTYMLSGKLKDVSLGRPYSFVGAARSKGGFSYRRKEKIIDREKHPIFEVPAKAIDDFVWGKVKEALKNPEFFVKKYLSENYGTTSQVREVEIELNVLRKNRDKALLQIDKIEEFGETGTYSEEKMARKVQEQEIEVTKLEERIQELEDSLTFIASRDLEVEKLKDAAEKVKYNLDNLTIKQKRALCNLVIEGVYLDRKANPNWKGKRNKWDISTKVVLRFNPNKFPMVDEGGRTQKADKQNKKAPLEAKNVKSGGPSWS